MTAVAGLLAFFLGAVALRLAWPSPGHEISPGLDHVGGGVVPQDVEAEEPEGRVGFNVRASR